MLHQHSHKICAKVDENIYKLYEFWNTQQKQISKPVGTIYFQGGAHEQNTHIQEPKESLRMTLYLDIRKNKEF